MICQPERWALPLSLLLALPSLLRGLRRCRDMRVDVQRRVGQVLHLDADPRARTLPVQLLDQLRECLRVADELLPARGGPPRRAPVPRSAGATRGRRSSARSSSPGGSSRSNEMQTLVANQKYPLLDTHI